MPAVTEAPARDRTVGVLAATIFALGCGEELWQAYMPAYLSALGASGLVVGIFTTSRDLLDSLYQYPGGWIADRLGRRRALLLFTALATAGYATYALSRHWVIVFGGLLGVMCWKAGAFATTFAIIGDAVPEHRRTVAFSIQSILVRLSRIVAAPLGGTAIAAAGVLGGMRWCFAASVVIGLAVLLAQRRLLERDPGHEPATPRATEKASMPYPLRRLLLADCLVRIGEGISGAFIVLFLLEERSLSPVAYGLFYALQQTVSLVSYLPSAYVAARAGQTPLIALTLACFSLFPLCVRHAATRTALAGAFVVGGLKELGEPARKALIVTLAPRDRRAETVGLYYAIRNLLVVPAGVLGGLLWQRAPHLPLEIGCLVAMTGLVAFLAPPRNPAGSAR